MAISDNPTLKGILIFGALTIGAVAIFVGPEDSEGILAITADNSAEAEAEVAPTGPKRRVGGETSASDDEEDAEYVEWSDEALMDNTAGFDPTPSDADEFDAGPTDSTINSTDAEANRSEVNDRPIVAPGAGEPVAGGLVPIG